MNVNVELLKAVANATAANAVVYLSQSDAMPLMQHKLITVDPNVADPNDASKRAAKLTDEGAKYLASGGIEQEKTSQFSVLSGGFERPKSKRVGGFGKGAPAKYPFDTMGAGDFFFVANSAVSSGDAVKTMASAVGSANQRYAEDVKDENGNVKTKQVTRAKRGPDNKAIKGEDGKNIKETVTVSEKNFTRKFLVSPVEAGKVYGQFTAPANGAVVSRSV